MIDIKKYILLIVDDDDALRNTITFVQAGFNVLSDNGAGLGNCKTKQDRSGPFYSHAWWRRHVSALKPFVELILKYPC